MDQWEVWRPESSEFLNRENVQPRFEDGLADHELAFGHAVRDQRAAVERERGHSSEGLREFAARFAERLETCDHGRASEQSRGLRSERIRTLANAALPLRQHTSRRAHRVDQTSSGLAGVAGRTADGR